MDLNRTESRAKVPVDLGKPQAETSLVLIHESYLSEQLHQSIS